MNRPDPIAALNRLLAILGRSLPVYLEGMRPWTRRGADSQRGLDTLADIAADLRSLAGCVTQAIVERRGEPAPGHFPIAFTADNDLALEYVLRKAADYQRHDIQAIESCAAELADVPDLRPLADEVLAHARRHLGELEELTAEGASCS